MYKQDEIILAYISKGEELTKKTLKSSIIASAFFAVISIAISIVFLCLPAKSNEIGSKIILSTIFMLIAIFMLLLISFVLKSYKKQQASKDIVVDNRAIYLLNGNIYINNQTPTYFPVADITDIKTIHYTNTEYHGLYNTITQRADGYIKIKTKNNKYKINNIDNVDLVHIKLLSILRKEYLQHKDITFLKNNQFNYYYATINIDEKHVNFEFYDDKEKNKINLNTLDSILDNFTALYDSAINGIVEEFYETALDWSEDNDDFDPNFSKEDFKKLLNGVKSFSIYINEKDYSLNIESEDINDLFSDHLLVCECELNSDKYYVSIEG